MMVALSCLAFFNRWPALFAPLFNGLLISLTGSLKGLLSAPARKQL
jgi:hypothetical protein